MRTRSYCRGAFGIALAAAILAGCGGAQSVAPQGVMPQSRLHQASGSWMLPSKNLDASLCHGFGFVYAYAYPSGILRYHLSFKWRRLR